MPDSRLEHKDCYEVMYTDCFDPPRFVKGEIGVLVEVFTGYKYDVSLCFGTFYSHGLYSSADTIVECKRIFMFRNSEVRLVPSIPMLHCVHCNAEIGRQREKGKPGRQREYCDTCYKAKRRKNQRAQDARRADERKAAKKIVK